MFTCKVTGKEVFLRPEDLEIDRNLLRNYTINNILNTVKKKFKCKK